MYKLLQINTIINSGSTGHIAESLGEFVIADGWESYIAYGRNPRESASHSIKIGNKFDIFWHVFVTRVFDLHGLASLGATKKLIRKIETIKPDVIHLHNIHGYYLNYKILFNYLAIKGIPIVWTMHDCWAITGHCPHYTFVKCKEWQFKEGCRTCPQKKRYPSCILFSNVAYNFRNKRKYFNLLAENQLTIVTPSKWLSDEMGKSFLKHYSRKVIYNGINIDVFKPYPITQINEKNIILGVASVWNEEKGLNDFLELSKLIDDEYEIVLIGVEDKIIKELPENIKGIKRTESKEELAQWYSRSLCYFNASVEETFGMTCIEAQACGTPVVAYNSTAIPETFSENTGIMVETRNIKKVYEAIKTIEINGKKFYSDSCRNFVVSNFNEKNKFQQYIELYKELTK
ncbi:glycosyltransferase [Treponema sp. C6A8]|uniref:glycosyltransferase n=1 Tax=Treponema sp. C6A8 TaxID=1410609 RepID=UPI000483DA0B|nr:glycosyltransferase [Treponema sp. C6A8]